MVDGMMGILLMMYKPCCIPIQAYAEGFLGMNADCSHRRDYGRNHICFRQLLWESRSTLLFLNV